MCTRCAPYSKVHMVTIDIPVERAQSAAFFLSSPDSGWGWRQ